MKFPWYKYDELVVAVRNTLQIFITNRCNLKCDGCFAREVMKNDNKDISLCEYQCAVDQAARKGARQINILGGEPLLHPNISLFCAYNNGRGLKTTIYTNGLLLNQYKLENFCGAKLRVSLDSLATTQKSVTNLVSKSKSFIQHIDANFMTTTKTTAEELLASADMLEVHGCKVFFLFNMQDLKNKDQEFFDCSGSDLVLSVIGYKKLVHKFLEMYNGNMEIHITKRGVFESTLSLPHNKCKFANYFIGGKIIQCPYDVVNLKYQSDYEFDLRYCQQNSTCLMSKIIVKRK